MKFSKFRNFRLITGEQIVALQQKVNPENIKDWDEYMVNLEKLTLGLVLMRDLPLDEARKEYSRLREKGNADEMYELIDGQEIDDLLEDLL